MAHQRPTVLSCGAPPLTLHRRVRMRRCPQITYQELTFLKQIGEGSFGRVYMARWRETTVAVKVGHVFVRRSSHSASPFARLPQAS